MGLLVYVCVCVSSKSCPNALITTWSHFRFAGDLFPLSEHASIINLDNSVEVSRTILGSVNSSQLVIKKNKREKNPSGPKHLRLENSFEYNFMLL